MAGADFPEHHFSPQPTMELAPGMQASMQPLSLKRMASITSLDSSQVLNVRDDYPCKTRRHSQSSGPSCSTFIDLSELSGEEATSVPHPAASVPDVLDEYQHDMIQLETWRRKEALFRPRPFIQPEINQQMRRVLVDWMSDVADDFHFLTETLFLAINYLDRFLGSQKVPRNILQLLGVTCLWLAAKYEEVNPPTSYELAVATDGMCDPRQMAGMEKALLSVLDYSLGCPTSLSFLHHYIHVQLMPQVSATMHPVPQTTHNTTPSGKLNHPSQRVHTPSAPSPVPAFSDASHSTPCAGCPQPHTASAPSSHASQTAPAGAEHFCRMAEVLLCVELLDPSYSQHLPSVSASAALYASSLLFRQPALVPAIFALCKAPSDVVKELGTKMLSAMYRVQQAGQRIACLRQYLEWQKSVAVLSTPPNARPSSTSTTPCSVPRVPSPVSVAQLPRALPHPAAFAPACPAIPATSLPPLHPATTFLPPLHPSTNSLPAYATRTATRLSGVAFPLTTHRSHDPTSLPRGPPTPMIAVCKPGVHTSGQGVNACRPALHCSSQSMQAPASRPPIPPAPRFEVVHGPAPPPQPDGVEAPSRKRILTRSVAAAAAVAALSIDTAESLSLQ